MSKPTIPSAPAGYNTVNPFIITQEADKLIEFVKEVFEAVELPDALTYDTDGLILHSEVKIGNAIVQIADRKPTWPFTPSLLQVYVNDVEQTLAQAAKLGAKIVTKPTDFLGVKFSRIQDQWDNLWWIYQYTGDVSWGEADSGENNSTWEPTEETTYIHDTLLEVMHNLSKK